MTTKKQMTWRRDRVFDLMSRGMRQMDVSKLLQIPEHIISRDVAFIRSQCKDNVRRYLDEYLPIEHEKCFNGVTSIILDAFTIAARTQNDRDKISALSLALQAYSVKTELLSNKGIITQAMSFVESKKRELDRLNNIDTSEATTTEIEENNPSSRHTEINS